VILTAKECNNFWIKMFKDFLAGNIDMNSHTDVLAKNSKTVNARITWLRDEFVAKAIEDFRSLQARGLNESDKHKVKRKKDSMRWALTKMR
jgi:hypothetical protein